MLPFPLRLHKISVLRGVLTQGMHPVAAAKMAAAASVTAAASTARAKPHQIALQQPQLQFHANNHTTGVDCKPLTD